MSTLVQIEAAVAGLPPEQQWSLFKWLQSRLSVAPASSKTEPEALKAFRQLQREVGLTQERAEAWKATVQEARR